MSIRDTTTKEIVYKCFQDLLNEKPLNKISVQDILNKSDICRSTFYRHFNDKYDLMNWFYQYHVEQLYNNGKLFSDVQLETMKFYYQNKRYFQKIFDFRGQNSFRHFIYKEGVTLISGFIKRRVPMDTLSPDLVFSIKMYNYGAFEMVHEWLMGIIDMTPEEFNKQRINNMPQMLKDILLKSDSL
ncbi:MAG: TetR/AcrR family transcriptional regulator C-terminal domain-containing protein [Desulfitobacterium sp.]